MNKKILPIVLSVVIVALIVVGALNYKQDQNTGGLSKEEAVNKALLYINENLMNGDVDASLVKIYDVDENSPYYTFQINVMGQLYDSMITSDGSRLIPDVRSAIDLNQKLDAKVDGNFYLKENAEIIQEDGKPVVFLFTSSNCPHCVWEKPVMQEVINKFGDNIVYKQREDTMDDQEIYNQFGEGGVPLIVIGGKYYREGAGENLGEDKEKEYLTKYICELTGNLPEEICNQ